MIEAQVLFDMFNDFPSLHVPHAQFPIKLLRS